MGVAYEVRDVDPELLRGVVSQLGVPPSVTVARRLLREKGTDADELIEGPSAVPWNSVLAELVTRRSWDLDKSIDRPHGGLTSLWRAVPDLRPVRRLWDEIQNLQDFGVPRQLAGEALIGLVPSHVVSAAAPVAARYGSDEGLSRLANWTPTGWRRFLPGASLPPVASDTYLRTYWRSFCDAIQSTAATGGLMGWSVG